MLIRLVRMTLHPDSVEQFLEIFDATSHRIRSFPGCLHLELWRDSRYPNIVMTFSHWEDEGALESYRQSDLFRSTWSRTKPLFAAPPAAWSCTSLRLPGETANGP